ncbi:AHH domain-containing protein [Pyxidicoccus xibeiensis]|uniref:AHH domain-containing protein n=1 Tax=Pyxidicoccus xibeiensis TaxID=2906759 RepID=UPI0020A81C9A|nr:AHH domain-containing protein [Pyxidicoccus xibeiensis]MCP3138946.1 AHH domain-containing protein [Pyxidicoccus xibeiensis]
MIARGLMTLLVVALVGCGTSSRSVRLRTGQGEALVFTPGTQSAPVELGKEEFEETIERMGRDVSIAESPRRAALRLFTDSLSPHSAGKLGIVTVGRPRQSLHLLPEQQDAGAKLARAYERWCQEKSSSSDCLRLLDRGLTLDEEGKRTLAFRFAIDSVWDETAEALEDLTDRDAVIAMLATTGVVYFGLWLLPEPFSKGVAAVLTVGLVAYLGWDTVWSLVQGWRVLAEEVRAASTFEELQHAGEKYGRVMGQNAARAFVMLAMAALGSTAQTMAAKLPTLPGSAQAALVGAEQGGFRLAAAGQVVSVEVASGGVITIGLDPGAVASTARDPNGAASGPVDGEGHEHHIATNKWKDATHSGGPWTPKLQRLFDRAGMSLDDPANRVRVPGHKGPHPQDYHEEVFRRLREATDDCLTIQHCREGLMGELRALAVEIRTPATRLNKLVTKSE